jgi:hypothetical protein
MKSLFFLLFLITPTISQGIDATKLGGLYFSGSFQKPGPDGSKIPLPFNKQSRLHITKDGELTPSKSWSLSFTFCLRDNRTNGALFVTKSKSTSLSFYFSRGETTQNASFTLLINGEKTEAGFILNRHNIYDGKWFDLKLSVDAQTGVARVLFQGISKEVKRSELKTSGGLDINFGKQLPVKNCLAMIIKNLQLEIDDKPSHKWLFTEMTGNIAYDTEGSLDLETENCDWLINKHFFWEPVAIGEEVENSGYSKKPLTPEHLVITADKVTTYNLRRKFYTTLYFEPMAGRNVSTPSTLVRDTFVAFQNGYPDEPGILNIRTGEWLKTNIKNTPDGHYYGATTLLNPLSLDVYLFGGYGWYTFKNNLLKFNNTTQKWDTCQTTGEKPIPCYLTAIFTGANPTDYFIFGGMGVASGRQEDTQHPVWTLHKLDLKDLNWKKVWQWKSYKNIISYYTAAWSNNNMNELYAIALNFGINTNSTVQRLALLSLSDSNITFVGNTLPRPRKGMAPYPLYVDNETGIVYFIDSELHQKDSTPVVFAARTPILSESEYTRLLENTYPAKIARLKDMLKYSMLFFAAIVLPVGFVILFKKKRKKKMLEATQKLISAPYSVKSNYITLFGGLTIIDKNGTLVKDGFTPKLIELFSLILLYSSHGKTRGISFAQLDNLLWFDLPPENLKNNRNVAFSRLRAIIKSDSGISLITEQDSVRIKLPPGMTNEPELFYNLTLKHPDPLNIRKTSKFFTIISRGVFLQGIRSEWAHEAREEVTSKIIKITLELMAFYCEHGEYHKCLDAADAISIHALLSEEVLRFKITALIRLNRNEEASGAFKIFCAEYKLRYKEEYGYDFEEFLGL